MHNINTKANHQGNMTITGEIIGLYQDGLGRFWARLIYNLKEIEVPINSLQFHSLKTHEQVSITISIT